MTGIYGAGRAFNLKYRPNGPLKTYIYDRRMPIFDFGYRGPRGGGYGSFMSENIYVDYGKRGFWGNLADIFTGLAAGAGIFTQMYGMFGGGKKSDIITGPEEEKGVKAQGAKSDDSENFKRLETFAKLKEISVVPEGNGKFSLMGKDGQHIKDATYDEAQNWIFDYNREPAIKANTKTKPQGAESANGDGGVDRANEADGVDNSSQAGNVSRNTRASGAESGSGRRRVPAGFHMASEDSHDEIRNLTADGLRSMGNGKYSSANKLTEGIIKLINEEWFTNITDTEYRDLVEEIIRKNPSIFNEDGTVKDGVKSLDKLDIPNADYIKKKYPSVSETSSSNNNENNSNKTIEVGGLKVVDEGFGRPYHAYCSIVLPDKTKVDFEGTSLRSPGRAIEEIKQKIEKYLKANGYGDYKVKYPETYQKIGFG